MLRSAGIVALFVLAACGQTTAATEPSPSPVIAQGIWTQALTLTGDLPGQITSILPDDGAQVSICSGGKARNGDTWSESFYATVDSTGDQWQMSISIDIFRGPGTYTNKDIHVVLQSPDNSKAWLNQDADKVTFTIERSQQSGTIDAQLTNAATGKTAAERITGHWNCRG
ncbi:MAG TPA: hypothetical protein VHO95_05485 [Candidatus Dormibacteraeota bacterium]|jgi:hypothetical protein|nr:hypothetical protein [Candidatus Dormibacteraeota bacterium]